MKELFSSLVRPMAAVVILPCLMVALSGCETLDKMYPGDDGETLRESEAVGHTAAGHRRHGGAAVGVGQTP